MVEDNYSITAQNHSTTHQQQIKQHMSPSNPMIAGIPNSNVNITIRSDSVAETPPVDDC